MIRTRLQIAFARTATVAQVNSVLAALDAVVVDAVAGVPILVVRIPDSGIGRRRWTPSSPAPPRSRRCAASLSVLLPAPSDLPDTHPPGGAPISTIDHLLAARAPAAWNVREALDTPGARVPDIIEEDYFGDGPPAAAVDASVVASDYVAGSPEPRGHGYHVLGTMLGTFAEVPSLGPDPDRVVGLFPRRTSVRAVDHQSSSFPSGPSGLNEMIRLVRDASGHVVVNSSVGLAAPSTLAAKGPRALIWIELVRTAGPGGTSLEGKFIHAVAAANFSSVHAAVSVGAGGRGAAPGAGRRERRRRPAARQYPRRRGRAQHAHRALPSGVPQATSSNIGGTIAAVGTDVFSLTDRGRSPPI